MNYLKEKWTSDLIIQSDVDIKVDEILSDIENEIDSSEDNKVHFPKENSQLYKDIVENNNFLDKDTLMKFYNYRGDGILDATGVIKGEAISRLYDCLLENGSKKHTISFGGDIVAYNKSTRIKVSDKFYINISNGAVFTSNNSKREGHIRIFGEDRDFDSVTICRSYSPFLADYEATKAFSSGTHNFSKDSVAFFMKGNYPTLKGFSSIYCASPFFNDKDIEIRDRMIEPFDSSKIFRPDLTEASNSYETSPGEELAKTIFSENIVGIRNCDILLFPKRTKDLGTLFEVGHALYLGKIIISYDHLSGEYEVIDNELAKQQLSKDLGDAQNILIHLNSPGNAILLGYLKDGPRNVYYLIPEGQHDNIMLANSFDRVNENYEIVERNYEDID